MLHKEMMLCSAGGGGDVVYSVTVQSESMTYGYDSGDYWGTFGSLSPTSFDGGTIGTLAFFQMMWASPGATTNIGNVTLNGYVCFVVYTSKTSTYKLKFTRLDTNASVTTVDCKAGTLNGKSFLAWSSSSDVANSGLFSSSDVGKTIKVKIEKA